MTDETSTVSSEPVRKKPGRKPGQTNKPAEAGPVRSVSMNPRPSGLTMVDIRMELPLALAIELASAAAAIQTKAEAEKPSTYPRTAWVQPATKEG